MVSLKTEQQLCVIHQIRNFTKYVSYKDIKQFMADLELVYGAPILGDAEYWLEEFRDRWYGKYPQILKSWDTKLEDAIHKDTTYLSFFSGLLGSEMQEKKRRSEETRIKLSRLPHRNTLEEFDFGFQPSHRCKAN